MLKIQYLELALKLNMPRNLNWAYNVYAITKPNKDPRPVPSKDNVGMCYKRDWGFEVIIPNVNKVEGGEDYIFDRIDDAEKGLPLFGFKDEVVAMPGWLPNIKEPVKTFVGTLHLNSLCIVGSFGAKMPYVTTSPFSIGKIEQFVVDRMKDTPEPGAPRDPNTYYVDELIKFNNSIPMIEELSSLCLISSTPRLICPPTGIIEYRDTLEKSYGDKLKDPVIFAEFEGKLKQFDNEYMKGDPSAGKFAQGKVMHTARKKMFLTTGVEMSFHNNKTVTPIITSLYEEYPKDAEKLAIIFNGQKAGSYSRGAETVDGGVTEKITNRALADYSIKNGDCGTYLGKPDVFYEHDYKQLAGRYIIDLKGKSTLVENVEDAANYLGKAIRTRSPMFCIAPGEFICEVCAGVKFAKFRFSLSIPVQEISAKVLLSKLKKMHGTVLKSTTIELQHFS